MNQQRSLTKNAKVTMSGIDNKTSDPDLRLEVDAMILDDLVHRAIQAVLRETKEDHRTITKADEALHNVNNFLELFNFYHAAPDLPDLDFRLQVLQLVTMVYGDNSPKVRMPPKDAIKTLRERNAIRQRPWDKHEPLDVREMFTSWDPHARAFGGRPGVSVLLIDLLPLFMKLSAMISDTTPEVAWMTLAVDFMTQAILTLPGSCNIPKSLREAFVWGAAEAASDDAEEQAVRDMLCDEGEHPQPAVHMWLEIRRKRLLKFQLNPHGWWSTLKQLRRQYDIKDFMRRLGAFLESLAFAIDPPILVQLEAGKLKGLSEEETTQLKMRCGMNR